jgi:hypothetical protein
VGMERDQHCPVYKNIARTWNGMRTIGMSALGLGCVETLCRKCRGIAIFFQVDYALIAAMSG